MDRNFIWNNTNDYKTREKYLYDPNVVKYILHIDDLYRKLSYIPFHKEKKRKKILVEIDIFKNNMKNDVIMRFGDSYNCFNGSQCLLALEWVSSYSQYRIEDTYNGENVKMYKYAEVSRLIIAP